MRKIGLALKFYIFNSFVSYFPNHWLRLFYLKKILYVSIGEHTSIGMGCFFAGRNIIIGNNTVINRRVYFDGRVAKISIGNNVSISQETTILTMTHAVNSEMFEAYSKEVVIEDYVWTGFRATILPGAFLGKGCVLGASSVASKSLEDYSIYSGIPATKIGERNRNLLYQLNYFPYFNTDIC